MFAVIRDVKDQPDGGLVRGAVIGYTAALGDVAGVRELSDAFTGEDLYTGEKLSTRQRIGVGILGSITLLGTAFGGRGIVRRIKSATTRAQATATTTVERIRSFRDRVRNFFRVRSANPSQFTGYFARVDPNDIRFSQTTAGGGGRAAQLRESMRSGWNGPAVDAVTSPHGLVTLDNTRIAVARELAIREVPVKVRLPSDPLPPSMLGRFGNAKTWGEALQLRTGGQHPPLPPSGTVDPPRMP